MLTFTLHDVLLAGAMVALGVWSVMLASVMAACLGYLALWVFQFVSFPSDWFHR